MVDTVKPFSVKPKSSELRKALTSTPFLRGIDFNWMGCKVFIRNLQGAKPGVTVALKRRIPGFPTGVVSILKWSWVLSSFWMIWG